MVPAGRYWKWPTRVDKIFLLAGVCTEKATTPQPVGSWMQFQFQDDKLWYDDRLFSFSSVETELISLECALTVCTHDLHTSLLHYTVHWIVFTIIVLLWMHNFTINNIWWVVLMWVLQTVSTWKQNISCYTLMVHSFELCNSFVAAFTCVTHITFWSHT